MYTAAKNLGEDIIAAIELALMAISGVGLAIVVAKTVQKTLKFAYHFMQKHGKSLTKNTDDFLKSFDVDEAVREAIDDYARELNDAAKAIPKKKIEINTKAGVLTLEGFYWKRISYFKRSRVEYRKMRTAFGTERKKFIKSMCENSENVLKMKSLGISDLEIELMLKDGLVPDNFNVHHKIPLDDGGTNSFDNLILIRNKPYHDALTDFQAKNVKSLTENSYLEIEWPITDLLIHP
jgi:hypothetical protein